MSEKRLSEAGIAALRAGVERAKRVPEGFAMELWAAEAEDAFECVEDSLIEQGWEDFYAEPKPVCGVVGCLAFEIAAAAGDDPIALENAEHKEFNHIAKRAATLLGLEPEEATSWGQPLNKLFMGPDRWPVDLRNAYSEAEPFSAERVAVLEQAVERWIEGDGNFE